MRKTISKVVKSLHYVTESVLLLKCLEGSWFVSPTNDVRGVLRHDKNKTRPIVEPLLDVGHKDYLESKNKKHVGSYRQEKNQLNVFLILQSKLQITKESMSLLQ